MPAPDPHPAADLVERGERVGDSLAGESARPAPMQPPEGVVGQLRPHGFDRLIIDRALRQLEWVVDRLPLPGGRPKQASGGRRPLGGRASIPRRWRG